VLFYYFGFYDVILLWDCLGVLNMLKSLDRIPVILITLKRCKLYLYADKTFVRIRWLNGECVGKFLLWNSTLLPQKTAKYLSGLGYLFAAPTGADSIGPGGTYPHFYKWLGTRAPWVEEQQTRKWPLYWPMTITKALTKTTCRPQKVEGHDKKLFRHFEPDVCPHFQIRSCCEQVSL